MPEKGVVGITYKSVNSNVDFCDYVFACQAISEIIWSTLVYEQKQA